MHARDVNSTPANLGGVTSVLYELSYCLKPSLPGDWHPKPKSLVSNVWNTYIGNKIRETKCKICNTYKIDTFNYECGHIIAEASGGNTDLENLLPICGECNKSMGIEDMDSFVNNIYKNNFKTYEKFKNKKIVNEKSHSLLSNIF